MPSLEPIWMYWTGDPMPEYIQFCVETVRAWHPGRVVFATEDDMEAALRDLGCPPGRRFRVQHEADILRAWLLKERGGYWIDCDFMCFAPVDGVVPGFVRENQTRETYLTGPYDFACYRRFFEDMSADNDFVWAAEKSVNAGHYWNHIKSIMEFNDFDVPEWAAIGGNVLTAMMNRRMTGLYEIPFDLVTPFRRMCLQLDTFMPNEVTDEMFPVDCRGVMLVHSLSRRYLADKDFGELAKSRTVIGAFIRHAVRRLTTP